MRDTLRNLQDGIRRLETAVQEAARRMQGSLRCTTCGNLAKFCQCRVAGQRAHCPVCGNLRTFCTCPGVEPGRLNYPDAIEADVDDSGIRSVPVLPELEAGRG